jgi:Fe-S cluster assembly protein SufD
MTLAAILERSHKDREGWRYTDVKALMARDLNGLAQKFAANQSMLPSILQDKAQQHQIVFINGIWEPDLSRVGQLPKDVMTWDGHHYRLTLEGQTCLVTAPIELVFLTDNRASTESTTSLRITVGENGRLTLIEHHLAAVVSSLSVRIVDTEIILGAHAKLVHGKMIHADMQAAHLTTTRVGVAKGAYYDNFAFIKGGRLVRNEIDVSLDGPLAQCNLSGVMLLRGHQHADTTTRILHAAPHGTSNEFYKSVIADQARGVFQGKIIVAPDAQKTDGKQLSRALLLSDQAEMNAKPELEIHADDVKCSHGSTVGDLDADTLFYLRARGLDESEARALLIRGFVDEAIATIHMPEWQAFCRKQAEDWLHEHN